MIQELRPWGEYYVLYDDDCKIKRLIVLPMKKLSLQSHMFRKEHWLVVKGKGKAQIDNVIQEIHTGSVIIIEKNQKHRLINDQEDCTLEIIEIQTGTYFGEDDIIRYEDDYNRI